MEAPRAGSFVELPARTVHTFANETDADVVWVTGWRPKGFERFFGEFGVANSDREAAAKSVSPGILSRVMKYSESYGMFVKT